MLRTLPTILTQAASRSSTRWRAKAAASSCVSQVLRTTILSVIIWRKGFGRRRLGPLGYAPANRVRVFGVLGQIQILRVRFPGWDEIVHVLQRLAQPLKSFGRARVPQRGFLVPVRGGAVVALFHVLVADVQVLRRFQRIQRILFWLESLVFFGEVPRAGRRGRGQLRLLRVQRNAQ